MGSGGRDGVCNGWCGGQSVEVANERPSPMSSAGEASATGEAGGGQGGSAGATPSCSSQAVCSRGVVVAAGCDVSIECADGCREDAVDSVAATADPRILCNEYLADSNGACLRDFDCIGVGSADAGLSRCSASGRCATAAPAAESPNNCSLSRPNSLPLGESRAVRGRACLSGICLVRHTSIDPLNTMCTSLCSSDADCTDTVTPSCLITALEDERDVTVGVCMPALPW
jgi:hypothetical protein